MFCPSCGREVDANLQYCKTCGARLTAEREVTAIQAVSFNLLLGGLVGIPLVGIAVIFSLVAAMRNGMNLPTDLIFALSVLTFFLFALAEIGCIIMLIARSRAPKKPTARELPTTSPRELPEPNFEPMPVGSVTDRTTRTLNKR
jgi:hypothetical protein